MTTLNQFIAQLQELQHEGYGECQVMYRHGASGDCGPLSFARVTSEVDDSTGPFDLAPGEQYVSIYAGN